jgi:hypothetical protein
MTAPKTILIGDRVRYESAAGTIRGEVVDVVHDMNAAGNVIPWIVIEHVIDGRPIRTDCFNYEAAAERYAYERMMEM